MKQSGLLDKLEVGDQLMADKGQDLLAPIGVKLNIPPFLSSDSQFSCEDVLRTKYCKGANSCGESNWTNQRILCLTITN